MAERDGSGNRKSAHPDPPWRVTVREDIHVARLPEWSDPHRIAEWLRDDGPNPKPKARVMIDEVTHDRKWTLRGVAGRLEQVLRNPTLILVCIPADHSATVDVAHAFDMTVLVGPDAKRRAHIPVLREFLPALTQIDHQQNVIGSANFLPPGQFSLSGVAPSDGDLVDTLRKQRGDPLHEYMRDRQPDLYSIAAPDPFHKDVRGALSKVARVGEVHSIDAQEVRFAGFAFSPVDQWNPSDTKANIPTPDQKEPSGSAETKHNGTSPNTTSAEASTDNQDNREPSAVSYDASAGDSPNAETATKGADGEKRDSSPADSESRMGRDSDDIGEPNSDESSSADANSDSGTSTRTSTSCRSDAGQDSDSDDASPDGSQTGETVDGQMSASAETTRNIRNTASNTPNYEADSTTPHTDHETEQQTPGTADSDDGCISANSRAESESLPSTTDPGGPETENRGPGDQSRECESITRETGESRSDPSSASGTQRTTSPELPGVPTSPTVGTETLPDDSTDSKKIDTDARSHQTPQSANPKLVHIEKHVLNEIAIHATTNSEREVYAALAADSDGVIRNHTPIDSEEHVLRRRTGILFKPECGKHMRQLAEAHRSVDGRRLAGDIHSHPESGRPRLSPADKKFCNRVWRTGRNTTFVVGLDSGTGPNKWTTADGGYEVQREVNGHLLRIRAFSGTTKPKRIRISRNMT